MRPVAALFVRADSIYKTLPGVDAWDIDRDARNWPGGAPVVAHPPCRRWGKLRQFAHGSEAERMLAPLAVSLVQLNGGVLEHPAESLLWVHSGLPLPGRAPDLLGGWTAEIRQCDWGHPAEKRTWLYIIGLHPDDLPPMPPRAEAAGLIKPRRGVARDGRRIVTKREREATPPAFAEWLVQLARRTRVTEIPEARGFRQVLKAERSGADATDRETPANSSPDGGPMGAGQAAAAAPAGAVREAA